MRLLLVEDEPMLGDAVRERISRDGHAVDWVMRLDEAEAALAAVGYELVLLDLHLPDGRGLDLLRAMRQRGDRRPVLILTARDQVRDRIEGLNAGADDYLVKPFDLDELTARIGAIARRAGGDPTPTLTQGSYSIDRAHRRVRKEGREVALTAREWALVDRLAARLGTVVAKSQLEDALYEFGEEVESNAVEVHVSRLRKKLGAEFIETVRGLGYRLSGGE
ncbi:MAG: response regulator transcription factor [Rhizobiales bacterium]|nr:response regulator transcription factor [Hyphomicrobiales bacterium]